MEEKDREREDITPATMKFVFQLSKGECHKQLTGTCSLEVEHPDRSHDSGEDSDHDFCPKLFKSLTSGKYPIEVARRMPVDIIQYGCGHWEFNDGQHRVCIAKRKELSLEAEVSTLSTKACSVCEGDASKYTELR